METYHLAVTTFLSGQFNISFARMSVLLNSLIIGWRKANFYTAKSWITAATLTSECSDTSGILVIWDLDSGYDLSTNLLWDFGETV